jgi:glycosyltransferase involved in cell wall biosynthesis
MPPSSSQTSSARGDRVRALFLHPHFTYPGGGGRVVLELAQRLARRGHETHVVSQRQEAAIVASSDRVRFHELPGPLPSRPGHYLRLPALLRDVSAAIEGVDPDVVVANVAPSHYWAASHARRHPGRRTLWYCHDFTILGRTRGILRSLPPHVAWPLLAVTATPPFRWHDARCVARMDDVLACSRAVARSVRARYGREARVIHPGVDVERFRPATRREPHVLLLGHLTRVKGMDLALRALAECAPTLRQEGVGIRIVGDGPERARLERLARELGLLDLATFDGKLPAEEVPRAYGAALLTLFPSPGEPFGLVALESMACGTPVVAVDADGPRETVVDGSTGLLAPATSHALAAAIERLVKDAPLREAMGVQARKHVLSDFTWDAAAHAMERALAEDL